MATKILCELTHMTCTEYWITQYVNLTLNCYATPVTRHLRGVVRVPKARVEWRRRRAGVCGGVSPPQPTRGSEGAS